MCDSLLRPELTQRRMSRHAVEIPCELITSTDDTPRFIWATDMSADGLWIDTRSPLGLGEVVVVGFAPGVFWRAREIQAFAEVVRISFGLRWGDGEAGMGLRFLDLSPAERWALRRWLQPRPQPRPHRRGPAPRSAAVEAFASPFSRRVG